MMLQIYSAAMWALQPLLRRKLQRRGHEEVGYLQAIEERFDPEAIRRHAEQFSIQRFNETFKNFVDEAYKATHLQRIQRS